MIGKGTASAVAVGHQIMERLRALRGIVPAVCRWSRTRLPQAPTLTDDTDPPPVLPVPLQRNLHIPLPLQPRKLLSHSISKTLPSARRSSSAERLQFPRRIHAVKIDVIKISPRTAILMHQREGRAGDVFFRSRSEASGDSLNQRGFPRPKIASQQTSFGGASISVRVRPKESFPQPSVS